MITGAVAEYEGKVSPEAMCARDADELECLIQAIEYREHGNQNTRPWIDRLLATTPAISEAKGSPRLFVGGFG